MLPRAFKLLPITRIATEAPLFRLFSTEHLLPLSPFETNTKLTHLVKANRLTDARQLFDQMHHRDAISWTIIISGYIAASHHNEAISLFYFFLTDSSLSPDSFILSLALKACALTPSLHPHGHAIQALTLKSGAVHSVFVGSSLLDFHSRASPNDPSAALKVFHEMRQRNVVTWTSAIAALVHAGKCRDALLLFADMPVPYDSHTYAIALKACADAGFILTGREIHAGALKDGHSKTSFVANALVTLYSKSHYLYPALTIFKSMQTRDVASWTTLISTYTQTGRPSDAIPSDAIAAFHCLLAHPKDGTPNDYTYAATISACSTLGNAPLGAQIHAHAARSGFSSASSVSNALVTMYARAGLLPAALAAFRETAAKDLVSWSAVIAAHAQEGCAAESFALFQEMRCHGGVPPTETTLASLLSVCASAAVLDAGRQTHTLALTVGLESNPMVTSALITMYAKCGGIDQATAVFASLQPSDTISWTAMINGYAEHGRSLDAIQLFDEMDERNVKPDSVTYLGVLTACSHCGMVEDGLRYLDAMRKKGMEAEKEHYGCLVDMLGRAGRLKDAEGIVESIPAGMADEVAWTALLRSCEVKGEAVVGRKAAGRAAEMDPGCAGVRVVMANLYRWREAASVRKEMREKGVRKEVGWSWVAGGGGEVQVFVAAGREHPRAEEVYEMIGLVNFGARMVGTEVVLEG
ncbi:LOW QUALITY PROTEIN: putative pentatricopeptide repeat-containing protein At3g47840 [Phalaenopsis equestris]|uniref:LOW QUALITY PROTEIN: putative pentatricopeptide repeat-containing protein At3g47840 n=1 Tax=Phalaenopsis equestris TaxID=78828 RepID=UPI0009E29754|nr:LOW QUALITY PROTEIN: putative pentatricopeptide repeat-containing protein At3g47840 [Phalaenopsis equestris]